MRSKITTSISEIIVDDIESIAKELQEGSGFELMFYDTSDEKAEIGIWLHSPRSQEPCTIMFDISKDDALFLGEALISLSKRIKPLYEPHQQT